MESARARTAELGIGSFFNTRVIGYALQRAWVFMMFLDAASASLTRADAPIPPEVYLISSCALCVILFAAALNEQAFLRFAVHRRRRWLGPALTMVGTLCCYFTFATDLPIEIAAPICGILTGFGSGLIDLGYGEVYRNVPPEKTAIEIPFATFLAAAIYAFTVLMPDPVPLIIALALPLASGFAYLGVHHIWEPDHMPNVRPVTVNVAKFTWRIGVCACMVGIADSVVRQTFIHINHIPLVNFYQPGMLISCLVMLIILVGHRLLARDVNYRGVYKFVVFVMAFFFMLLPVFTGSFTAESIFALVAYNSFNVLIWMLLAELAYTYRLSSLVTFGIGWGMVTLGVAAGQMLATWFIDVVVFTPQIVSLVVLVCTMMVLGSYMFVLHEDDMIDITKVDEETDDAENSDGASEDLPRMSFQDRCLQLAEKFKLTPRETEIMALFARGRSSTRIQEELVLSRGTVTTHLRHIYQKMGVHTKQELLDLIEEANAQREPDVADAGPAEPGL